MQNCCTRQFHIPVQNSSCSSFRSLLSSICSIVGDYCKRRYRKRRRFLRVLFAKDENEWARNENENGWAKIELTVRKRVKISLPSSLFFFPTFYTFSYHSLSLSLSLPFLSQYISFINLFYLSIIIKNIFFIRKIPNQFFYIVNKCNPFSIKRSIVLHSVLTLSSPLSTFFSSGFCLWWSAR